MSPEKPNLQCQTENKNSHLECQNSQPVWETRQVIYEMKNYKLDVLGVSEMRWIGQGIVRKEDMTILYSGKEEHHSHSVGIIMNKKANKALTGWKPIDHRIITAQFQTQHSKVIIIQAYALE